MNLRVIVTLSLFSACAFAQWPNKMRPGTPLLADGTPNLSAPVPKMADGHPDLSGVWQPELTRVGNLARDLKPGEVSMQPWAETLYKHRQETLGKEDPQGLCVLSGVPREDFVPYPFKILNSPGVMVVLYEALHSYRQIFMDGRALPKSPNPAWMGYSIGRWEGDTLVVESAGFNEMGWLDNGGHPNTESLHLTERFHRRDFGHIDLQVTIDDPKAYTKPWTVSIVLTAMPEGELIEYVCDENEKDFKHLVGK